MIRDTIPSDTRARNSDPTSSPVEAGMAGNESRNTVMARVAKNQPRKTTDQILDELNPRKRANKSGSDATLPLKKRGGHSGRGGRGVAKKRVRKRRTPALEPALEL